MVLDTHVHVAILFQRVQYHVEVVKVEVVKVDVAVIIMLANVTNI